MNKQKAFTLIELLVVVAIIGLLASIVLVSVKEVKKKAKFPEIFTTVRRLEIELELLLLDYDWQEDADIISMKLNFLLNKFNEDVFDYSVAIHRTNGIVDYFDFRVGVSGIRPSFLCRRQVWRNERKWLIYDDHPWAEDLNIPGAEHI